MWSIRCVLKDEVISRWLEHPQDWSAVHLDASYDIRLQAVQDLITRMSRYRLRAQVAAAVTRRGDDLGLAPGLAQRRRQRVDPAGRAAVAGQHEHRPEPALGDRLHRRLAAQHHHDEDEHHREHREPRHREHQATPGGGEGVEHPASVPGTGPDLRSRRSLGPANATVRTPVPT